MSAECAAGSPATSCRACFRRCLMPAERELRTCVEASSRRTTHRVMRPDAPPMPRAGKPFLAALRLAAALRHRRPLPRLSRAILCSFPGGANKNEQHRMPAMAALLALMRSSVIGPTPSAETLAAQIWRGKTGTLENQATLATERCGARHGGHPFFTQRCIALRVRPARRTSPLQRFSGCFTRDSISQTLPPGEVPCRKTRRQRTKSPLELRPGACSRMPSRE